MTTNGRTTWIRWLAGIVLTIIITAITALANNVVANDRIRADEDQKLSSRVIDNLQRVAKVEECMQSVKTDVAVIKSDIKQILREMKK